jgi:hypothetical protein
MRFLCVMKRHAQCDSNPYRFVFVAEVVPIAGALEMSKLAVQLVVQRGKFPSVF